MDFGELLSHERSRQGLTLAALSKMTGLPITTIHNYERGSEPTLSKADVTLKALGIGITIGVQKKKE